MPSERILFVDDDPVSRRAFARSMRQSGFIVDLAKDGDEAWELATHFPYAVIATDLRMPGMDGMMLIDQLRELQPDPVCLLVTGCKQLEWYREPGDSSVDVIQKPWNGDQLAEALRQAIGEYRRRSASLSPSEQPAEAREREVISVGINAGQRERVVKALGQGYRAFHSSSIVEATEQLRSRPAFVCCLVDEALAAPSQLQKLAHANSHVPLIVLGSGDPETAAVHAIRQGAQDWLAKDALESSLGRVVAVACERARMPKGPLPVCTELSNPSLLFDRVRQATSRARRFSHRAAVLILDIDRFGDVNHSLGYDAGDELLVQVAERLRSSVRESDAVFRLQQDEFALVLEDLGAADGVGVRLGSLDVPAQRVLNSFATPFACRGHEIVLTASLGGAVFPTHGQTPEELIKRAETALDTAKHEGRNRYCTYSEPVAVIGAQGLASHPN